MPAVRVTYAEALAYIDGLIGPADRPRRPYHEVKLARMRALLERLGSPERGLRCTLVAGTKGKGSTAAMLAEILARGGLRVGLAVKPHLLDYRERIQFGGRLISRASLARLVETARPAIDAGRADEWGPPTYVEATVAMALLYFRQRAADIAVIEVGIGGTLDATNVTDPLVSVITPISYDHIESLGSTLTEIAGAKAGIIRPGRPVVSAPQPDEAARVIADAARSAGSPLMLVGRDVACEVLESSLDGTAVRIRGVRRAHEVQIPLLGRHQAVNAATAVAAAEQLLPEPGPAPEAVRGGLAAVRWPARVELISRRPHIIIDVGHNPASAQALRATLDELLGGRRMVLAFGMLATKDYRAVTALIAPPAAAIVTTTPDNPHALPAADLAAEVRRYTPHVDAIDDRRTAVARARTLAGPEDVLVVTGSFYFVGEARSQLLQRTTPAPARR